MESECNLHTEITDLEPAGKKESETLCPKDASQPAILTGTMKVKVNWETTLTYLDSSQTQMSDDSKNYISRGQATKEKIPHDKLKVSNDMTWIKEKYEFAPSDIQIQAKRRVILDTLLFFLIMMGKWMKNRNINGKWDQHQESDAKHDEHLNWNIEFGHDKRLFGFLKFRF